MIINIFSNFSKTTCFIVFFLFAYNFSPGQNKGGRWQFENNGNDSCDWNSNAHNGFISGSATYANAEPLAEGNYYLSLENVNDYGVFCVDDNSDLDFQNESIAISLWVYPIQGNDNPQFLLMKGDRSGNIKTNNYALRLNTIQNKNYLEFIAHLESGTLRSVTSSFEVPQNQWSFIAVYYDYTNSKIYLWNDETTVPADTFNFTADLFSNNNKLYIGTSGENGFKRFWGRIDDVRISNKVSDIIDNTTNIELSDINSHPFKFILNQNYPNPFNPETTIRFSLLEKGFTKLDVYNLLGEHIFNLVRGEIASGEHTIHFNASNLPSGIYFYKLQQGSHSDLKKMILLK